MEDSPLALAHRALADAVELLIAASDSTAGADDVLSALTMCEGLTRRLDHLSVTRIADLTRRGTFADRGYRSPAAALVDLLRWERGEAGRRVRVGEQVGPRVGVDGQVTPPRLAGTARVFAAGAAGLRHVETVARELGAAAAGRLSPSAWAAVEEDLGEKATMYSPSELADYARTLIDRLDQDGPPPDDDEPAQVNRLTLAPRRDGSGGTLAADLDAVLFDAVASAIDERPHLNLIVRLEDLKSRARAAMLDFGGTLSPEQLRMLACDARVVPIVMDGVGQPLDVGRATRIIPDGLRRAIAARDRGCAHAGCGRPVSWCEIHHIVPWEVGGETKLDNCVMLCRYHHRLMHRPGWRVRIRDGLPEFIPPRWIDHEQRPRRKPTLWAAWWDGARLGSAS